MESIANSEERAESDLLIEDETENIILELESLNSDADCEENDAETTNVSISISPPMSPVFPTTRFKGHKKKVLALDNSASSQYESCQSDLDKTKNSSEGSFVSFSHSKKESSDDTISTIIFIQDKNESTSVSEFQASDTRNVLNENISIQDFLRGFTDDDSDSYNAIDPLNLNQNYELNVLKEMETQESTSLVQVEECMESISSASFESLIVDDDGTIHCSNDNSIKYKANENSFTKNINTNYISTNLEVVTAAYIDSNENLVSNDMSQNNYYNLQTISNDTEINHASPSDESEICFPFRSYGKSRPIFDSSSESLEFEKQNLSERNEILTDDDSDNLLDADIEIKSFHGNNSRLESDISFNTNIRKCKYLLRQRRNSNISNISSYSSCKKMQSNKKPISQLKKHLVKMEVRLKKYKDFWNDCRKNAEAVLKILKSFTKRKLSSQEITKFQEVREELEIFLDKLELNENVIISYTERVTRSKSFENKRVTRQKTLIDLKKKLAVKSLNEENVLNNTNKYKRITATADEEFE